MFEVSLVAVDVDRSDRPLVETMNVSASRVEIVRLMNDVGNIFTSVTELSSDTDIRAIAFLWKREDVYKKIINEVSYA